ARWIALIALSLHPLLLDFSIAARGYGLSMTLFTWSLYFCLNRRGILAGMLLGLAVSANMTIAFPALALLVATLAAGKGNIRARLRTMAALAIPCAAVFVLICYSPL